MKRIAAILVFTVALAACGGGNSGSVPKSNVPAASLAPKTGSVTLTISVPSSAQSSARRPAYVSPATAQISVTPQGGERQLFYISQSSPSCTTSVETRTCTFNVSAPAGQNIALTIATYARSPYPSYEPYGAPLSVATILVTVVPGQSNPVKATLNGVVAKFNITLGQNRVTPGAAIEVPVTLTALDSQDYAIVGPGGYADASGKPVTFTLHNSDFTNSTTLSQTAITQPTSGVVLRYNGSAAFIGATISVEGVPCYVPKVSSSKVRTGTISVRAYVPNFGDYCNKVLSSNVRTGTITEYPTVSHPKGITAGPDGNVWFTEDAGTIARITPSGVITAFLPPNGNLQADSLTAGPDGNLWFTDAYGNMIGRFTLNGTFTEFPIPTAKSFPSQIVAGPDGNLWFMEDNTNQIGRITPGGVITEFPVTTPTHYGQNHITAGPDGNLWFDVMATGLPSDRDYTRKLGRITPSGVVTVFPAPTTIVGYPQGITPGPDGNVWLADFASDHIDRVTPSGVITAFGLPQTTYPLELTFGADGNLWFTELNNRIGRLTPRGEFAEFPIPTIGSDGFGEGGITSGPDGNLWFAGSMGIGRITP